jgi:hypothetical protein
MSRQGFDNVSVCDSNDFMVQLLTTDSRHIAVKTTTDAFFADDNCSNGHITTRLDYDSNRRFHRDGLDVWNREE